MEPVPVTVAVQNHLTIVMILGFIWMKDLVQQTSATRVRMQAVRQMLIAVSAVNRAFAIRVMVPAITALTIARPIATVERMVSAIQVQTMGAENAIMLTHLPQAVAKRMSIAGKADFVIPVTAHATEKRTGLV